MGNSTFNVVISICFLFVKNVLVLIITLGCIHLHSLKTGGQLNGYPPSLFLFFLYVCVVMLAKRKTLGTQKKVD